MEQIIFKKLLFTLSWVIFCSLYGNTKNRIENGAQTFLNVSSIGDTCYHVMPGDTIGLIPSAPEITLDPELICGPSVIKVRISGRLRTRVGKWVIYGDYLNQASILGSTRSNEFIDFSMRTTTYYVREEECLFDDNEEYQEYRTIGLAASKSIAYNLTDTDGDGTNDCDDRCPNDPLKTYPDQCGCNNEDIDTDRDDLADCIDADDDGDGIEDELDNCPLDQNELQEDLDADALGDVCDPEFNVESSMDNLIDLVNELNTPNAIKTHLLSTLSQILPAYCNGDMQLPIDQTKAFSNKVNAQKGKKIPTDEANKLIEYANALLNAIKSNTAVCPQSSLMTSKSFKNNLSYEINVFPNPVENEINIRFNQFARGNASIDLVNLQGLIVQHWSKTINFTDQLTLQTKKLESGIYFLSIQLGEKYETIKIFAR